MVLSIGDAETSENCQNWKNQFHLTYPIGYDENGDIYNLFGDGFVPYNVVLDRGKIIHYSQSGFDEDRLRNLIENLISTPYPTPTSQPHTPTPNPSPTPTPPIEPTQTPILTPTPQFSPTPFIGISIETNKSYYKPGDNFELTTEIHIGPENVELDEYIVLDVFGQYWFWPNWSQQLDKKTRSFNANDILKEVILSFQWPSNSGSAQGITFWAALVYANTIDIYGNYSYTQFGFGE